MTGFNIIFVRSVSRLVEILQDYYLFIVTSPDV